MRTVEFDAYVIDTLMRDLVGHDRHPSAFLIYLYVWRRSGGPGAEPVRLSLRDLAAATGLSKRAVQDAIGRLERRELIEVGRASITAVPEYAVRRPWARRG